MREWEEEHDLEKIPIIALTAHTMAQEVKRCFTVGCTAHLGKPIRKAIFLELIDEIVEQKGKQREKGTPA